MIIIKYKITTSSKVARDIKTIHSFYCLEIRDKVRRESEEIRDKIFNWLSQDNITTEIVKIIGLVRIIDL